MQAAAWDLTTSSSSSFPGMTTNGVTPTALLSSFRRFPSSSKNLLIACLIFWPPRQVSHLADTLLAAAFLFSARAEARLRILSPVKFSLLNELGAPHTIFN